MTKKIPFRLPRLFAFILSIGLSCSLPVFSQQALNDRGTTGNALLAAVEKSALQEVVLKESNVEYPQILKGSEEKSTDYVAKFSERRRDYLVRMYSKGKKLLPKAAKILKKYSLPEELKILMILESAYNANAVSKAGAVGYWQFMDVVAKEYGLRYVPQEEKIIVQKGKKKNKKGVAKNEPARQKDFAQHKRKPKGVDDRKNFDKATNAAARYLKDRKVNLDGNWLLVVASYNCGVGNVWKAMEKSNAENPGFWDIKKYLPAETQAYVMNFIALNVVYSNYDQFLKNNLIFTPVKSTQPCDHFEDTFSDELAGPQPASK